jgi:lysophospholipase L1-like esterase
LPASVVVLNASGAVMTRNVDYKLNDEWGQVMNLNSRLGAPGTGSVSIDYRAVLQRLDLVEVLPDGSVAVKKGTSAPTCPVLPDADPDAVALAGVHVFTLDGAKESGFSILPRDINAIQPAPPVAPINPDAIPNTLAKLAAGRSVNVAFFGNSITAGAEAGQWRTDRSKTFTDLVTNGLRQRYPQANVTETLACEGGKAATNSQWVFQKLVMEPHQNGHPVDLVVIELGMNDLGKPSLDPYKQAMDGYIDQARAAGIEVLLVTPHQSNPYYDATYTNWVPRAQIAQAVRDLAAAEHVACADVYTEWVNQATHGVAPVSQLHNWFNHPGEAGMRLYADTILRFFPAPAPPVSAVG